MKKSISFFISLIFILVSVIASSQAITLRGTNTASGSAATTITLTKPTGTVQNDVMIAVVSKFVSTSSPTSNVTAPADWTLVAAGNLNNSRNVAIFYKIAGAAEGASYVFTTGANTTNIAASIVSFYNVNITGSNPFGVTLPLSLNVTTGSTTATALGITTSSASSAVLMVSGVAGVAGPSFSAWSLATSPAATALTEINDVTDGSGASVGMAWTTIQNANTATGNGTATLSASERSGSVLIPLQSYVGNLWATYNNTGIGNINVSSGSLNWGPNTAFTAASTIASLARNTFPNQTFGNYYWIVKGNKGVVDLYGSDYQGLNQTALGTIDFTTAGNNNNNISYAAMAIGGDGTGYILAKDATTGALLLTKFSTGTALSSVTFSTPSTLTLTGTTATNYVNGDIAVNGDGSLIALGNSGTAGTNVICKIVPSTSKMALSLTLKAPNGTNLSGIATGLALDLTGAAYVATSTGLFYIPQNYMSGYSGSVNITLVSAITGLTDLATNYHPNNIIVPVPVKMGDFSAKLQNNQTLLNWNTLTEINSHHFEIERSLDGIRFTKIGTVNAAGNSTDNISYQYADAVNGLSGVIYYRLKTVDIDTKSEYSKIVAVRLNGAALKAFVVYPNPCVDNMKISVTASSQTTATIRISNMAGQQVIAKNISLQQGDNVLILTNEISTLKPGMHMLELISAEGVQTQKIIKK